MAGEGRSGSETGLLKRTLNKLFGGNGGAVSTPDTRAEPPPESAPNPEPQLKGVIEAKPDTLELSGYTAQDMTFTGSIASLNVRERMPVLIQQSIYRGDGDFIAVREGGKYRVYGKNKNDSPPNPA